MSRLGGVKATKGPSYTAASLENRGDAGEARPVPEGELTWLGHGDVRVPYEGPIGFCSSRRWGWRYGGDHNGGQEAVGPCPMVGATGSLQT